MAASVLAMPRLLVTTVSGKRLDREAAGEMPGRRAAVDHDDLARRQEVERAPRDPLALRGQLALALGERRLDADRRQRGAAVGAAHQAAIAQRVEIAPHGLGRDPEGLRQRGDPDRRIGAQLGDDPLAPLQLAEPRGRAQRASSSAPASSAKPAPPRASVTHAGAAARRPAKSRTFATPTAWAK